MTIGNLNPTDEIGASAWLIELNGHRILLDSGIHPRLEGSSSLPLFDLISDQPLDAIAITHCHHDHCGSLPLAARYFPDAHILMTELSYFLLPRILHNSVNVMQRQREEKGIPEYPLYTHEDVDKLETHFQGFRYNREVEWLSFAKFAKGVSSPTLEFFDAGHTLGAAGIHLHSPTGETLFYTGDCCLHDQTLLRKARFNQVKADVLIMETTRGDHESNPTHSSEIKRLSEALIQAQKEKRSVLIPVFALGRTQEILTQIVLLMHSGKIPFQHIFIGGLGKTFTRIYDEQAFRTNRNYEKLFLTDALDLSVLEQGAMERIKLSKGHIFAITAGMMNENTPAHDMALRFMLEEKHSIFFVGYADPESPAGRLKVAPRGEPFFFSNQAKEVTCNCNREYFDLTGHSLRQEMLDFVGSVAPKIVVLGHGSPTAKQWFAEQIHAHYPSIFIKDLQPKEFFDTEKI